MPGAGDQLNGAPSRVRGARPHRLVVVVGTGTGVGKTWVGVRLLRGLVGEGARVAARKPVQSFDPGDDPATLDAALLGAASGERAETVCLPHRVYEVALAPPLAAAALGRPPIHLADLVGEVEWFEQPVDVGLVETAGGVRSPMAVDGDAAALCRALQPDLIVLVADAGLGAINAVRLSAAALSARLRWWCSTASTSPWRCTAPISTGCAGWTASASSRCPAMRPS